MPPKIPLPRRWKSHVKAGLLHAISLARLAITIVRGECANSPIAAAQLASENQRLEEEVASLKEELRIKDARLARIPARERPQYPPTERMAILTLQASRGWSTSEAADRFFVTPATLASWHVRLEEHGPDALVQVSRPVNKFPDFVTAIVQQLKGKCPVMGNKRIANTLGRAALHLAPNTARNMLKREPRAPAPPTIGSHSKGRTVTAWYPHHVWNLDLTVVPITGLWAPWFPGAFLQLWPLCWWVLTIVDHFSRYAIGFALFPYQPTAAQVCTALDNAVRAVGRAPKYTVSDQGGQFQTEYRDWCAKQNVKPRFGAVGKYGSIAVIERFHLTIKQEALRLIHVPFNLADMRSEMVRTFAWYNLARPHMHWAGATPAEILHKRRPRNRRPRIEPRARYPADSACAAPQVKARAVGCRLELVVSDFQGAAHLPVVVLKKVA